MIPVMTRKRFSRQMMFSLYLITTLFRTVKITLVLKSPPPANTIIPPYGLFINLWLALRSALVFYGSCNRHRRESLKQHKCTLCQGTCRMLLFEASRPGSSGLAWLLVLSTPEAQARGSSTQTSGPAVPSPSPCLLTWPSHNPISHWTAGHPHAVLISNYSIHRAQLLIRLHAQRPKVRTLRAQSSIYILALLPLSSFPSFCLVFCNLT